MATTIVLKNSVTTTNAPSSLAQGEVAINVTDKKVWVGNAATTPIQIVNGGPDGVFTSVTDSGLTNTRVTYAGAGGLLKDSASITTDGTTLTAAGFSGPVGATTASTGAFTTLTATNFNAASTFGFKNRIINGNMVIDQRNAGASVTITATAYTLDRWQAYCGGVSSKFSVQQNSASVTPPVGFTNYLGTVSLSAYSVLSTDRFGINQSIEGLNAADLDWGTANAKTVTLSFWVRSSLTGTFGGSIQNYAATRSYPFNYTITTANTWELETITIAGDTSGTWLTTNSGFATLNLAIGTGSTYSGTAGAWATADYRSSTSATSVVGTNGATFYITGVQLEVGSSATGFDYRDITTELVMCQRYFEKSVNQVTSITTNNQTSFFPTVPSTTVAQAVTYVTQRFVVTKRTAPTMTIYPYTTATNTTRVSNDSGADLAANSANVNGTTDIFFSVNNNSGGTITTGAQLIFIANWYASAEL